ncbi:metal ABC transporter permease, partial [Vibrio atlanticus]|nr:metal ABC transporter permease [Vibrio atlanticus]
MALVGNIVLGQQVLNRQIIFIDLAVAQVAALGAALS